MEDLKIPKNAGPAEEFLARFRIACRRCGSADIALDIEESHHYSERTYGSGNMQAGCNSCRQNDFFACL